MVKLRGVFLGIVMAAVAVGFAAAMPGAMSVSDDAKTEKEKVEAPELEESNPAKDRAHDAADQEEALAEEEGSGTGGEQEAEEAGGDSEDNHGSVVSAVARCDVKGRFHGEAVRLIAQDKDATLADAEAACEAAKAAAAAGDTQGKPATAGSNHGKPAGVTARPEKAPKRPTAPKPAKAPKPAPAPAAETQETPPATEQGPPAGQGASNAGGSGGGNPNKP